MSMALKNTDSVKRAILDELHQLLSEDNSVRRTAEEKIKLLLYTEVYGVYLAEVIMNQSFPLPLRQMASIMLTRFVESNWVRSKDDPEEMVYIANEQAKRIIKTILPNGLYDPNSKIRTSVAHTISKIVSIDYTTAWTELFGIIITCLGGNENSIHGALQILQEFNYEKNHIEEHGSAIIAEIYRVFASRHYSISTQISAVVTLKILVFAISTNITDREMKNSMINSIMTGSVDKLLHYLSMNCGQASNFTLRTQILKLFTFFVTENAQCIEAEMGRILPIIWQLLTQNADIYVKVIVNQVEPSPYPVANDDKDNELINLSSMIIQIMEFIQCVVNVKIFLPTIKMVLTDLIYIIILYIQVPREQIDEWNEDYDKFVDDEDDGGAEMTIRVAGQDTLSCLSEGFGSKLLHHLQEALGRHMTVAEAEKNAGNIYWWKINEASMVAVYMYRDLILKKKNKFDLPNYLNVVSNWLNYSELQHLVSRALWTMSMFTKSKLLNSEILDNILTFAVECFHPEKSLIVKLSAVRAICCIVEDHAICDDNKRALIQVKLPIFIDSILELAPGCKNSVLSMFLETFTNMLTFDPSYAVVAQIKIVPFVISVFLKYPEDPFLMEYITEILKILCINTQCLLPLQEKITPTLVGIMSLRGPQAATAKQDIAIDVLASVVKYSKAPLPPSIMQNAFPAMIHCVMNSEDPTVMVSGGDCLRFFIYVSPDQVSSYNNCEGLKYTIGVTSILLDPMNDENTAAKVSRLIIAIINNMGNILGENIDLLLKGVISKMQRTKCLKVAMNLVVVFAHLFVTKKEAILNFLFTVPGPTGEPAIHFVLNFWLPYHSSFYGNFDRKVTNLALLKIFEYGVATQDSRLSSVNIKGAQARKLILDTSGTISRSDRQNLSLPVMVLIFKLLIIEMYNLKETSSVYESDSDLEDSSESGEESGVDSAAEGAVGGAVGGAPDFSPAKSRSANVAYSDDGEISDDDQLTQKLLKDPVYPTNMKDYLSTFFRSFSTNEQFPTFLTYLSETEKNILKAISINLANLN